MKTILCTWGMLVFGLLAPFKSFAQATVYHPFPTDSAVWTYLKSDFPTGTSRTKAFVMRSDTIIAGKKYSKIYKTYSFDYAKDSGNTIYAYLRVNNDSQKVWMRYADFALFKDTSEFLLFDFNLNMGDTFYARRLKNDSSGFIIDTLRVTSFDSTYTLQGFHKQVQLTGSYDSQYNFSGKYGSITYLFYPEIPLYFTSAGGHFSVLCFKEKNTQYFQGQDCFIDFTPNGVSELVKDFNSIVYPVPQHAGGEINVKTGSPIEVSYVLSGVDGIEYAIGILQSGSGSFKLPDGIPAGVYFLKLGTTKIARQIHKIIIL